MVTCDARIVAVNTQQILIFAGTTSSYYRFITKCGLHMHTQN